MENTKDQIGNNTINGEYKNLYPPVLPFISKTEKKMDIWFNSLFDDLHEIKSDRYPDYSFFKKEDKYLFEFDIKNKNLYVEYNTIWKVMEKKYGLNRIYIEEYTKKETCIHLSLEIENSYSFV